MHVEVEESSRLKNASGMIRDGKINIRLPKRWPKQIKQQVTQELVDRLRKRQAREEHILNKHLSAIDPSDCITLNTTDALRQYVQQLNNDTFKVPLKAVRIGTARYSRLAQMNIRTKTMTVSRYCLTQVPQSALRYLIVHELAHLLEASHNRRFWHLVAQYVPDYPKQSALIKAFHQHAVSQGGLQPNPTEPEQPPLPRKAGQSVPSEEAICFDDNGYAFVGTPGHTPQPAEAHPPEAKPSASENHAKQGTAFENQQLQLALHPF